MSVPVLAQASDGHALIVDPRTGEAFPLQHATTETIARWLTEVRETEQALRDAKRIVTDEVTARMDTAASWTLPAGPYKLKSQSPTPEVQYDAQALRNDLEELAAQGVITQDAVDAAVQIVVTFNPRAAGINALRKLPAVAQVIDRHCSPVERVRRVSVSRAA